MQNKLKSTEVDLLVSGMMCLTSPQEYYNFFEDLLTIAELKSIAARFSAAKLLSEGKTYVEVAEATGVSSATISRISRCLAYGADGYNLVLERLKSI